MGVGRNDTGVNSEKWESQPFQHTIDATAAAVNGFNTAALMAAIVATGLTFPSATAVGATDVLHDIDIELKPVGGHYSPDGVAGNEVSSIASDAKVELPAGSASWRDLDPGGDERQANDLGQPLNDFTLNVTLGSIVVISGAVSRKIG